MSGSRSYGRNMLKKIGMCSAVLLLCSCGVMPGIENPKRHAMKQYGAAEPALITPTLIPITPSMIRAQKECTYFYRVVPADVLRITVWQHPEFLMEIPTTNINTPGIQGAAGLPGYLVNAQGAIYFPLVGSVQVINKTVDQIRADITHRLKHYIPNPQVAVRVADFRGQKVYVLGEVEKTGFLPITDQRLSLADALSLSGWLKPNSADARYVYIIRGDVTKPDIFWMDARTPDRLLLAEHFSLQPRDILYVSSAPAARWNRALNQILPTVQAIWYTQAITRNA